MTEAEARIEAVARCLAKCDGGHVPASEWAGDVGNRYRATAREALATLTRFDAGARSGGLPVPGTRINIHYDRSTLPHV